MHTKYPLFTHFDGSLALTLAKVQNSEKSDWIYFLYYRETIYTFSIHVKTSATFKRDTIEATEGYAHKIFTAFTFG